MKVNGKHYRSLWADEALGVVHIIDQTRLPHVFEIQTLASADAVADAIRAMAVARDPSDESISVASKLLRATRPTAINLAWAIGRMRERLKGIKLADRAA